MVLLLAILVYLFLRVILPGFYTVQPNERAVKTVFGRAVRISNTTTLDAPLLAQTLERSDQKERYVYPQVRVIMPGLHFKFPWEKIYKTSIATELINIAYDPENRSVNSNNTVLEAVTKDQLNIGLRGQLRYTVSERNLYAYIFGVNKPIAHVMGYFISVLRERISNFEALKKENKVGDRLTSLIEMQGISINDLRKNLGELNRHMEQECTSSAARYGIGLDAALITAIEPPADVESALSAINTAHNEVSSQISLAQASADQKIVQSQRAVEIETLQVQAEVQTLKELGSQLVELKKAHKDSLSTYLRNVRLELFSRASRLIYEMKK